MKKSLFTLAFAAMMIFASCAGSKTETAGEATAETTETAAADAAKSEKGIPARLREALLASKLVSEADFEKPIFIDFNATWCGPCRQFAPFFEAAAEKYADRAKFISVDVDVYGEVANAFGVQSIPTVIAVVPGQKPVTYVGTQDIIGDGVFDAIVEKFTK